MKRIKCPHCDWKRTLPDTRNIAEMNADVIRAGKLTNAVAKKIKELLNDPELEIANAWIDLSCANCDKSYQYNVMSGETRK